MDVFKAFDMSGSTPPVGLTVCVGPPNAVVVASDVVDGVAAGIASSLLAGCYAFVRARRLFSSYNVPTTFPIHIDVRHIDCRRLPLSRWRVLPPGPEKGCLLIRSCWCLSNKVV